MGFLRGVFRCVLSIVFAVLLVSRAAAVSFEQDVLPVLAAQSLDVESGLGLAAVRLSVAGTDPHGDYALLTRVACGRLINTAHPQDSLLLRLLRGDVESATKPLAVDSADYRLVERWIKDGALRGGDVALSEMAVTPLTVELKQGESTSLSVTGMQAGAKRELNAWAVFSSNADDVVAVDETGVLTATGPGEAAVSVRAGRRQWTVPVRVPFSKKIAAPPEKHLVDRLVSEQLAGLGLSAAGGVNNATFMRRAYLRLTGRLPKAAEVQAFLKDKAPDKRKRLINDLLESPAYVEFRCLYLGDLLRIKSEFPSNLWPNAVQAYYQWIYNAVAENMPYDQFAKLLMTAQGSNFREPPANFYRALRQRDPNGFSEATALIFLGQRLDSPGEWTLDQRNGLANFFNEVKFKHTREWKEEIVYLEPNREAEPVFPDGSKPGELGDDKREALAQWVVAHPNFAHSLVNRVWYQLFGQGLVEEIDDLSPSNPASNPELLNALADYVVEQQFDVKALYRLIMQSKTFQRATTEQSENPALVRHYSHYPLQRMDAEVLLDAISQICGRWEKYTSRVPEPYTFMPAATRAVQLADGSIGCPFLSLFGRPPRDSSFVSERSRDVMMRQALHLLNSQQINDKISKSELVKRWSKGSVPVPQTVRQMFLNTLSRPPTKEEMERWTAVIKERPDAKRSACEDLLWTLLNSKEFIYIQ